MKFPILLVLCIASGAQSMKVPIEKLRNLILEAINETAPNFEPCDEDLLQKATFADMIEIKRSSYFHWCVFVQGETVIQLNNPEFDKLSFENAYDNFTGHVELRNLKQLAGDDFCRINNKISESKRRELSSLSKFQTLRMMKEELQHNITWYNVINYNCEHFATKLKFGVPFSSQIEAMKQLTAKEDTKETAAKMFEIAATFNAIGAMGESFPEQLLSVVD